MQRELKSELTKQLITDKAFSLFYKNGFKTTSIDKIMKETTLSKGAFYHHFKNKKEIGLAVISLKIQQRVIEGMIMPLKEPGDPFNILQEVFTTRLKGFSLYEKKHGCPMNNFINELGDHESPYQTALKNIIELWKDSLIQLIERGKAENTILKSTPSEAVSIYLISAFEGIRGLRKLYENDQVLTNFLEGLSLYLTQIKA